MARRNSTDTDTWVNAYQAGTMDSLFDWTRPTITLDGCLDVIRDLARTGSRPVSLKLAIWAGICSINTRLDWNGRAVRRLARFVEGDLPTDYDGLKAALDGTPFGLLGLHVLGLVAAQSFERAGKLPATPQDTWTLAQWRAWRTEMVKIPGVADKVASFVGLLICPETCPLVPVDRWHMRRLGLGAGDRIPKGLAYRLVEDSVRAERDAAGYPTLPLGAWAWYKWSQARQAAGVETPSVRPESHNRLSPRDY